MGLRKTRFLVLALTLSAVGCATSGGSRSNSSDSETLTLRDILGRDAPGASERPAPDAHVTNLEGLTVRGIKLKNTQFDYPVTLNSKVEQWIDYFCCGKGRVHFERYLERSDYFIPYIDPILRANNMPRDLVYLAMIESGFNNFARSHAKAVGPWQFISATGKRYGLTVNWWVDERRDVRKSTLSAVSYLRDLYGMFQSWELASAAYNAGESKVARAIRRYGTTDFWALTRQKFLRPETRNYVPKIIAAAIVAKNREQFGFPPARQDIVHPEDGEVLAADGSVVKVVKTDRPEDELLADGSDFDREPINESGDALAENESDPSDSEESPVSPAAINAAVFRAQRLSSSGQPQARPAPTPHITKDGQVGGEQLVEFDVQSPADLLKVARAAGLSYHTVKSLNPELKRWCTPPTASTYRLRLPASAKGKFLDTYNAPAYPREVRFRAHRAKAGETIAKIARRYGLSADPLVQLNGLSAAQGIGSGRTILLPLPSDQSRSLASLDVRDPPEKRRPRYRRSTSRRTPASTRRSSTVRSKKSSQRSGVAAGRVTFKQRSSARKKPSPAGRTLVRRVESPDAT